ncbi:hypothetical protein [Natronorubrum halophilum]|uniref:hypothetical protein n=1 Tax=Natronorubrum halophilum TaxID=1702106 RepID=UPI001EE83F04|nr:hypothetical protein [Natronorubrum halophilum]
MSDRRPGDRGSAALSRRTFVAGGLLVGVGGAMMLGDSYAFSQTVASRVTNVATAEDESALLGVSPVSSVEAGGGETPLVTVTNNTATVLTVSTALADSSQGSVTPASSSLESGASNTVSVSVAGGSATGTNALSFGITATDGEGISIAMTRSVDIVKPASLVRSIRDQSRNNNAEYQVTYQVSGVDTFDSITVTFENLDLGWVGDVTKSRTDTEGVITYSRGGAANSEYRITFDVYDASGSIVLSESVTDIADGDEPPGNQQPTDPDGPRLESFTVTDETLHNNTDYTVAYELSNPDRFEEVRVTFENTEPNKSWATRTETASAFPTGSVTYEQGGTEGDTYEITVDVVNTNGIVVDSGAVTHVAGSDGTFSFPE